MKLLDLHTIGVRGVPDGAYSFTDPGTGAPLGVVLITGGPAAGKTSLLEAIAAAKEAIGAYGGPPETKRLRRAGAEEARITTTWLLTDVELERAQLDEAKQTVTWDLTSSGLRTDAAPGLRRLFASYSRAPGLGKVEYFPTNRRLTPPARAAFGRPGREAEARARMTRARDKYACILDGLHELALDEASRAARALRESGPREALPDMFEPIEQAITTVLPALRLSSFELGDGGGLRFSGRSGEVVGLDELSDSEHQGVLLALAFRYFGLDHSIVLIDEPELHIHASARVRFLEALAALGRDNQIIAATGAAELVNSVERGQVITLSARSDATPAESTSQRTVAPSLLHKDEEPRSALQVPVQPPTLQPPARELAAPALVPTYLQAPHASGLEPRAMSPMASPPVPAQDGHETVMIETFVSAQAMPFVPAGAAPVFERSPSPAPPQDGHETAQIEAGALGPALPFAPPGKRLARFDPQTGRALPEPIWVDVPDVQGGDR